MKVTTHGMAEAGEEVRHVRLAVAVQGRSRGVQAVKLVALIEALRRRFPLLEVWDVEVGRIERLALLARTVHASQDRWRNRFHAHPATFARRTAAFRRRAAASPPVDAVLQVGVLFNADTGPVGPPLVVYTDYTVALSAVRGRSFRLPLGRRAVERRIAQESKALIAADAVCARSRMAAESLVTSCGVPPERVSIIGGGGNVLAPSTMPAFAATEPPPRFLFVGRDFHRKGGDIVLAAFRLVRERHPGATLTIASRQCAAEPVEGVRWLEQLSVEALAEAYARTDALVLAPRLETWGDVLIEAMGFGVPCIVPDEAPFDEIVVPGKTGFLIGSREPSAFAEAMLTVAADPDQQRRMGAAAREHVAQHFTWDVVADRLAAVILGVTAARAPADFEAQVLWRPQNIHAFGAES